MRCALLFTICKHWRNIAGQATMLRLCLFRFRIIAMQTQQPLKHTGYVIFDSWIVAFKHGNKWSIPNTLCVNFASFSYRIYFDSWFFCVVSMWNCHMHCVSCPNQFDCSWCAPESCTDQNANILHAEKFHGKMKGFMYIVHRTYWCRLPLSSWSSSFT